MRFVVHDPGLRREAWAVFSLEEDRLFLLGHLLGLRGEVDGIAWSAHYDPEAFVLEKPLKKPIGRKGVTKEEQIQLKEIFRERLGKLHEAFPEAEIWWICPSTANGFRMVDHGGSLGWKQRLTGLTYPSDRDCYYALKPVIESGGIVLPEDFEWPDKPFLFDMYDLLGMAWTFFRHPQDFYQEFP